MNQLSVSDRVKRLIAEQLCIDVSDVEPWKNLFDDLGADSLDAIEMVMAVEEEFDIEISDEDVEQLRSVADAIACVEKVAEKV